MGKMADTPGTLCSVHESDTTNIVQQCRYSGVRFKSSVAYIDDPAKTNKVFTMPNISDNELQWSECINVEKLTANTIL